MAWTKHPLESLCKEFTDGNWVESKDQSPQGIRLIQTGNVGEGVFKDRGDKARYISESTFSKLKCFEIYEGDCLISRLPDPVGRSCVLPDTGERMITAVDCSVVRFDANKVLPRYFNYYSQSAIYLSDVDSLTSGATRKRISRKNLGKVEIPTPPITEQKRIVAILDQAFADIDKACSLTEQNLKNARELFESYLQQVFSQGGEGWKTTSLKSIASKIGSGATPKGGKAAYKEEGTSLIRSMNVHDRLFVDKDLAFIDDEQAEKLSNVVVEKDDVLLNITGASVARCCVVPEEYLPARVNQHVSIIRINKQELLPAFLNYGLTSKFYKDQLLGIGEAGSTRQAITKAQIESFQVSYPESIDKQEQYVKQLNALESQMIEMKNIYEKKLKSLEELKKSLLQKAFSGELTKDKQEAA